jgi:hypothetical protein
MTPIEGAFSVVAEVTGGVEAVPDVDIVMVIID